MATPGSHEYKTTRNARCVYVHMHIPCQNIPTGASISNVASMPADTDNTVDPHWTTAPAWSNWEGYPNASFNFRGKPSTDESTTLPAGDAALEDSSLTEPFPDPATAPPSLEVVPPPNPPPAPTNAYINQVPPPAVFRPYWTTGGAAVPLQTVPTSESAPGADGNGGVAVEFAPSEFTPSAGTAADGIAAAAPTSKPEISDPSQVPGSANASAGSPAASEV